MTHLNFSREDRPGLELGSLEGTLESEKLSGNEDWGLGIRNSRILKEQLAFLGPSGETPTQQGNLHFRSDGARSEHISIR